MGKEIAAFFFEPTLAEIMQLVGFALPDKDNGEPAAAFTAAVAGTGSPAAFSSDSLSTGASYKFTFTQPGSYTYHCSIHPSMKGTVIVQS